MTAVKRQAIVNDRASPAIRSPIPGHRHGLFDTTPTPSAEIKAILPSIPPVTRRSATTGWRTVSSWPPPTSRWRCPRGQRPGRPRHAGRDLGRRRRTGTRAGADGGARAGRAPPNRGTATSPARSPLACPAARSRHRARRPRRPRLHDRRGVPAPACGCVSPSRSGTPAGPSCGPSSTAAGSAPATPVHVTAGPAPR